jgi:hypothetical protein
LLVRDILAMVSDENAGVDKLITYGQMALEQGWYDQAREYFEQALDLDASSQEALKGLVQVNEVLSRRMIPMPVEPAEVQPVTPPRKVERKQTTPAKKYEVQAGSPIQWYKRQSKLGKVIVSMGVQVLLLCLYVGFTTMIHPAPKATPTPTSLDTLMPAGPDGEAPPEIVGLETIVDAISIIEAESPQPTAVSEVEGGWLCDWDGRGEVALWSKPAAALQEGNTIVTIVEMPAKGCIDAILLDETTSSGIVFYQVRVGDDQGWVDVNYFYPTFIGKPDWSQ